MENETLFTRISKGEIPSVRLYEDEVCFVILDINPINKGHALVIAREPYPTTVECPQEVLSHMICIVKRLDKKMREVLGAQSTSIIINNGKEAGQEVPHIHIHVAPRYENDGRTCIPEHAKYEEGEMAKFGEMLKL